MKKYRFSDGTIVEASTKEEAIKQHCVTAAKESFTKEELDTVNRFGFKRIPETGERYVRERIVPNTHYLIVSIGKTIRNNVVKYWWSIDFISDRGIHNQSYKDLLATYFVMESAMSKDLTSVCIAAKKAYDTLEKSLGDLNSYIESSIKSIKSSLK